MTGALWAACLWLAFGSKLAASTATSEFVDRYRLGELPSGAWFAAGGLLVYLLGSLLVVRTSPIARLASRVKHKVTPIIERLEEDRVPAARRHKMVWKAWNANDGWLKNRRWAFAIRRWCSYDGQSWTPFDEWLSNEYRSLAVSGRVPVMRNYEGGCDALHGFDAFYATETVDNYFDSLDAEHGDDWDRRGQLAESFRWAVKNEQPAVEVRIQMRFPEVYAEIDRLKVEAELRMSIFWPLMLLSLLAAWAWSPFALALAVFPPFMLRDGFRRAKEASEKTWGTVVAGEVTTPILDAMRSAQQDECRDFAARYGRHADADADTDNDDSNDAPTPIRAVP